MGKQVSKLEPLGGPRERTFIMVKPDAVQRGLIHKVIIKMEGRGFKLVAMKLCQPD